MIAVLLFFGLQFLLLVPRYYFNRKTAAFFPIAEIFPKNRIKIRSLFARFNDDLFRVNLEYTLLILLTLCFKSIIPMATAALFIGLSYLLIAVIFYYHYSIYSIYKTYPALSVDWKLIVQGLNIARAGFKTKLALGIILILAYAFGLYYLNQILVNYIYQNTNPLLFICCVLIVLTAFSFGIVKKINPFRFTQEFDFHYLLYFSVQMTAFLVNSNRFFSKQAKENIKKIPEIILNSVIKIPENLVLKQKPNLYFIAIESYGAVLYENPLFHERHKELVNQINANLNSKNWHTVSALAQATVSGGKSWVAYSSFLKGIEIKSDAVYRQLFANQSQYETQSIFSIFEELGYQNFLVSGLGGFESYPIDWDTILQFLGTKNLITYKDLDYRGERFNFGPSAPDQYLLNKSLQLMKAKYPDQPISFFVETINSHYDFDSPTQLLADWKQCNEAKRTDYNPLKEVSKDIFENYFQAIQYQLKVLEELILNEKSNAVFVLFGDHQPPIITNPTNSYKTPIHIIGKDQEFMQHWIADGFESGLYVSNFESKPELGHFEMKNLFVSKFLNYFKT